MAVLIGLDSEGESSTMRYEHDPRSKAPSQLASAKQSGVRRIHIQQTTQGLLAFNEDVVHLSHEQRERRVEERTGQRAVHRRPI